MRKIFSSYAPKLLYSNLLNLIVTEDLPVMFSPSLFSGIFYVKEIERINRWCPSDKEVILEHRLINIVERALNLFQKPMRKKFKGKLRLRSNKSNYWSSCVDGIWRQAEIRNAAGETRMKITGQSSENMTHLCTRYKDSVAWRMKQWRQKESSWWMMKHNSKLEC